LERQLATAQARYQDFEDVVLQLERDKSTHHRQLEATRKELELERKKLSQLEQTVSNQKTELVRHRDSIVKLECELNKALTDLEARKSEVKKLEGKQKKTIVEHYHVLEEAKRVTDRQLHEAQVELQKNANYIRSLEKVKSRLTGEAEDLSRQNELELRTRERTGKAQEERAARALAELEGERRTRETAELQSRRLHNELQSAQHQISDLSERLAATQLSKKELDAELARLADDFTTPNSQDEMQREYEKRITQLESYLGDAESARASNARIKEHVDRHHAELRQLIMNGPADDTLRNQLLRELQSSENVLEEAIVNPKRLTGDKNNEIGTFSNITPTKFVGAQRVRRESRTKSPSSSDGKVGALKQHIQVLELQMAASDRVRRHLEITIQSLMADLESSDGSLPSLQRYRDRLSRENVRLRELLEEETQARRTAQAAQVGGVREVWDKFQDTIAEERESYLKVEESRKALVSPTIILLATSTIYRITLSSLCNREPLKLNSNINTINCKISQNQSSTCNHSWHRSKIN